MTTDHAGLPDIRIQRFNESFYRSDPADYLLTRFQLLMLAGARPSELDGLLAKGVKLAGISISQAEVATDDETLSADDGPNPFLTIESQQLLHHASETVLRLFLVHAQEADVPWVEMSSQRSAKEFKKQIRAEFIESSPSSELIDYVCLGRRHPPETTSSDWVEAIDGIAAFLRTFATCFLQDANLYNAIKHGLGVTASDAVATIGNQRLGFGASVEYPESDARNDEGSRSWSLTTRWIDITQSIGLTAVAIAMIDSIWRLGRYRHLGVSASGKLFFPVTLRPMDLLGPDRPPLQRMSWKLLTEVQNPRPESNPRSPR